MARMPPSATPHAPPDDEAGDDADAPALDHAGGVARLMGDDALFARVLARFRNEYRQTAAAIRDALGAGDSALALRLVHTLRGAAGMIEAVPLRRAAHALEQDLRAPQWDGNLQHLARLEQALARVLRELDAAALAAPPARTPGATRDAALAPSAGTDAVQRLAALLDDGNGEAVDLVHDAAGALTAQLGERRYGRLAALIDAYDFDGALALLAE